MEFVNVVADLLNGDTVTFTGRYLSLTDARIEDLPANGRVKLVVGGGHRQILQIAAQRADVVAFSGLGRTLADGHRHEVRWTKQDLNSQLHLVRDVSNVAGQIPDVEVLVQLVSLTDDRHRDITQLAQRLAGSAESDIASTPYLLIGSLQEMAAQLRRQADEFGITSYVVRESALETIEKLLPLLSS